MIGKGCLIIVLIIQMVPWSAAQHQSPGMDSTSRCFVFQKITLSTGEIIHGYRNVQLCACKKVREEAQSVPSPRGYIPHCTKSGDWAPLQNDGVSYWCVDGNGNQTSKTHHKRNLSELPCYVPPKPTKPSNKTKPDRVHV
ncbi:uncharacterized protein LOC129580597 [Paramacrobiotus metropolitanus]|uniref:uncharacterized protein LOC129580597 n=1 Tax=Paramacrobiotus metropolitanus TaxID=2943436 RepID=UPI002445D482|nr:uncharacterized protein LOC129580597 [Paramacrobiotus metropolitanus]